MKNKKIPYAKESTLLAVEKSISSYETEQDIMREYREYLRRAEYGWLRAQTVRAG